MRFLFPPEEVTLQSFSRVTLCGRTWKSSSNPLHFICTHQEPALSSQIKLLHGPFLHNFNICLDPCGSQKFTNKNSGFSWENQCLIHLVSNPFFFQVVICNMMFLICQSPRSSGAKVHPQCRGSLTFRSCNSVPYFLDKITDMLNEVGVNEAMFHPCLCCYQTDTPAYREAGESSVCIQTPSPSSARVPI